MDEVTIDIDELVLDAEASRTDATAEAVVAGLSALEPLSESYAAAVGRAVADSLATALVKST
jgi:hypothetical protein